LAVALVVFLGLLCCVLRVLMLMAKARCVLRGVCVLLSVL
jgi:hypothetical protein